MSIRFRYRHLHLTMFDYVKTRLCELGWGDASQNDGAPVNLRVNFGTQPITYVEYQPDEAGKPIAVNTIAVTLGDEPSAKDWEIGGGLRHLPIAVFVDIYGENQGIAQSIASDVKDIFEDVYLQLRDWTYPQNVVDVDDEQIELDKDNVVVEKPQVALIATDIKRYWRVVKTVANIYYSNGDA